MSRQVKALNLLKYLAASPCSCPAHSNLASSLTHCHSTSSQPEKDYAFEVASATVRYGPGVTREIGQDVTAMGAKKVLVFTDKTIGKLPPLAQVVDSLTKNKVNFSVFDDVRVEPTNESFERAIAYTRSNPYDCIIAVGGGSVMDTAKAANLFACQPEAELLDYVNPPLGKGKVVDCKLTPLIAVPTTSGTGSETTGVAVFDYLPLKAKTGIANRALRPTLGIIDPLHTLSMPERVSAYSGFDVLCHALESFTALPYTERTPRPSHPQLRPAYLGSNPVSDVWAREALRIIAKYFKRSVYNPDDIDARSNMHLGSSMAGVGFGNAGVHLCHGLSYPISGNVKTYFADGYDPTLPLIPHGLSVVITSPAVFEYTAPACPERHLEAAQLLGADITNAKREDAGKVLGDVLREYMQYMKIVDGISALGYSSSDIPKLVEGTLPQQRVLKIAPRLESASEDLASILENSLTVY